MLRRLSEKEIKQEINPSGKTSSRQLVQARAFLGFNRRATHPSSFHYLLGRVGGGHAIIDPVRVRGRVRVRLLRLGLGLGLGSGLGLGLGLG